MRDLIIKYIKQQGQSNEDAQAVKLEEIISKWNMYAIKVSEIGIYYYDYGCAEFIFTIIK